MATNSGNPTFGPWRWPDLDEPTNQSANDGYQPPAPLDGSMLFEDHLQDGVNYFPFDLSDDAQKFSLNCAESMRTTACAGGPASLDSPAHLNLAIRGQSDRPSSNWSSLGLQRAFSNPEPCAALDFAQQNLPSQTPCSSWSGIDNFHSVPINDTFIGSDLWVSGNNAALLGAGFGDSMFPQTVESYSESSLLGPFSSMDATSHHLECHGALNDLPLYPAALNIPGDPGYTVYNTHVLLDGTSGLPLGGAFNALDPNHHVQPSQIYMLSISPPAQEFVSKRPRQIDSHDSSFHTPESTRKKLQGSSMRGTKRKRSCRFCQLQKTQCDGKLSDTGKPCRRCHDIALDNTLAIRLCGYDLKSFDTRLSIIDFFGLGPRSNFIPVTCDQPIRRIRRIVLTHPLQRVRNSVIYFPDAPTLELVSCEDHDDADDDYLSPEDKSDVREYLNDLMASRLAGHGKLQPGLRITVELPVRQEPRSNSYVLQTTSLPNREKIAEWANFPIKMRHKIAPRDLQAAYAAFLTAYIGKKGMKAPHADLAKMTLDFMSLDIVQKRQVVDQEQLLKALRSNSPREHGRTPLIQSSISMTDYYRIRASAFLPVRAKFQLFVHVLPLVEQLEKSILQKIDDEIEGRAKRRPLQGDPMILGFVIRCLCLHYRGSAIRYKVSGKAKRRLFKNNQAMLDILTAHYGYIFKGTLSPFHNEWKAEQHESLLGNDKELAQLLDGVKVAEKYHYLKSLDDDCDMAYKRLVTEHETKRHSTLAKQWNKGSDPLPLAENLDDIQGQYGFELFHLNSHGERGQSGSSKSFTLADATKRSQPSDADKSTDLPSELHRVQSRTAGIQKSLLPTQEPLESQGESEPAMNCPTQNPVPVRRLRATLCYISPSGSSTTWQLEVGGISYLIRVSSGYLD